MKGRRIVASVLAAAMVFSGTFVGNSTDVQGADGNTPPGKPTELRTEMLEYAYGLNTKNPAFSWVVNDTDKNEVQTAYKIVVSDTSELKGDVLDTGWVASSESSFVHADALEEKLADNELYYWQVQTKDKNGAESPLSDARPFMTGIGEEWQSLNGIWTTSTPKQGEETVWADYTVEQTMSVTGTDAAFAVLLRMDAGNNGYMAQLRTADNQIKLHKITSKNVDTNAFAVLELKEKNITLPTDGSEFDIKIEVTGSEFKFFVKTTDAQDYDEAGTASIADQGAIAAGKIGYRTGRSESGIISRLKVTAQDGSSLYDRAFTDTDFPGCSLVDGKLSVGNSAFSVYTEGEEEEVVEEYSRFAFFRSPKLDVGDESKIDKAIVSSASRGTSSDRGIIYDIWMNGECLGAGSARELGKVGSYGGTSNYTQLYYNSYDVTELIKSQTENVISALGNCRNSSRSILVQMTVFYKDGTKKIITNSGLEDSGWKTLDGTQAFGDDGKSGISTGYVTLLHDNVNVEKYPAGWQTVEFDDSKWASAKITSEIAKSTGTSGTVLYPYSSENILRVETDEPAKKIYKNNSGNIVVDLGKEIIGGMKVDIQSASKQTVTVRMGEEMNADGTVKYQLTARPKYEDTWTLIEGKNQFETVTMRNFRYVEFVGLDDTTKNNMTGDKNCIKGWAMQQPFDDSASSFQASDNSDAATLLNRLYELSKYTIKATNQDVFVDSQARERAPYEGDLLVNSNTSYAVSDNYSLARHSNEWLMDNQTWPNDYRIFSVEMAYWDYIYTGNTDSIRECYNALKKKMTAQIASEDNATGLIHSRGGQAGESALIDWPTSERDGYQGSYYDVVFNSEYAGIYHDMALISEALGYTDDAQAYQAKADKLKETLLKYAFDEKNGCFYDSLDANYNATKHSSTHATAYALNYGVYESQEMADRMCEFVYNKCKDEMKGSVYVTYFILEGLYRGNHGEMAEALMTNPKVGTNVKTFASVLDDLNCTITPEAWGHKWKGNMTLSHPWGASPGCSIVQGMFGILPTSAGFDTFDIKLQPGEVASASVKAPTVKGPVSVSYTNGGQENIKAGKIQATVTIPANTKAKVYLPVDNVKLAWLLVDGEKKEAVNNGKYLSIELGSGTYSLAVSSDEVAYNPVMTLKAFAGQTALEVGDETEITAKVFDQFSKNLAKDVSFTYTSSDEQIVHVDNNGKITAAAKGEAEVTVTAKYKGTEAQDVKDVSEKIKFSVTVAPGVLKRFDVRLEKSSLAVGETTQASLTAVYTDGAEEKIAADKVTFEAGNDTVKVEGSQVTRLKEGDMVIKAVTSEKFDEMNAKMGNVEMKIDETYRFDKTTNPLSSCEIKEEKLYAGKGKRQATKKADGKSGNVVSGKFIVENVAANVAFNANDDGGDYYFWQFRKDGTLKKHDGKTNVMGQIPIELKEEENSFRIATVNGKIYTWLNEELIDICDTASGFAESGGFGVRNGSGESAFFTDISVGNGNAYLITSTISAGPAGSVDKEALKAAIDRKKDLKETDYTAASWKVLQDALTKANNILESETATQEEVNVATAELRAAYAGLKWVDKAGLRDAIERAGKRNEDDYTADSWAAMQAALGEAKTVESNTDAVQEAVDTATYNLSEALRNLKTKVEVTVNKNALNTAIARANARKKEEHTASSWKVLQDALKTATDAQENQAATQAEVDAATKGLREALDQLQWVDKSGLKSAIDRAGERNEEDYTEKPDEWAAMQTALEEANTVYKNADADQTKVDAATLKLSEALRALDPKGTINKNALEAAIARTRNLNAGDYTATSWKALQDALKTATDAKNSDEATQEAVNEATAGLRTALEGLVWIDKTGLKDAIERAGQRNEADYTAESWAAMQTALGEAKKVDGNADAVQTDIDTATFNLSEALRNLKTKVEAAVNKNALNVAIARANARKEEEHTASSWKVLQDALKKATDVQNNQAATQEAVDLATRGLREALDQLQWVDKSGLKAAIARAGERNEADYPEKPDEWAAMQTALEEAKTVNDNADAVQAEVDAATLKLSEALRALDPKGTINKNALEAAIVRTKNLNEADYTAASWQALQDALKIATDAKNSDEATQEAVNEATAGLRTALEGLVWIDKAGLRDAIDRAGQRNEADYTAESWAAMQTALGEAETVEANTDAIQTQIDTATYNLSEALRKLELKPVINKNALSAAIDRTKNLDGANYTAASWKALQEALGTAKSAMESETATQEEVNTATQALRGALLNLVRVDRFELTAAIDRAKERKEAEYTKESWAAMQKALTDAKAVYDNHDATQEKVDQATYELSEALRQLVYVEPEKAALDSAISEAKTLKKENYTPEAWSAFQKAIAVAEAILNNPDATKEQRAEAAASLKKAIEEVKKNPAKDDNKQPAVIKVSRIRISGPSQKIAEGKKVKLTAQVSPSNAADKGVIWKTSNKKVATVNSKGVVTMQKKSGGKSVTITATARDGSNVKATYKITSMKGKVTKVTIPGKKTRTVKAGKKLKLTAKVKAQKNANKKLKWTSSNTKYAKVSSSGKVTTKKAGRGKSVKITAAATDGSGKKYTVKIKIK